MKFTGIWIPADIAMCKTLSDKAKIAYGLISSLDNEDGCYASNGYISSILDVEERQVRNVIDELIKHGLVLRILNEDGRIMKTIEKAAIEVAMADSTETTHGNKLPGGRQKVAGGGGKKLPPYNKGNNKDDSIKKELSPLPFNTPRFIESWNKWVDYRRDLKKPMHWKTINFVFEDMKRWGEEESITAIDTSIKKGWLGLFGASSVNKTLTPDDHRKPW